MVHPCFTAIRQPEPQTLLIESLNLPADGLPKLHQVIPANVVAQRMGVNGFEGVLVMESHGREQQS